MAREFDQLPYDCARIISSRLSFNEAVAASSVLKRWMHAFDFDLLDFNPTTFNNIGFETCSTGSSRRHSTAVLLPEQVVLEKKERSEREKKLVFCRHVNSFLSQLPKSSDHDRDDRPVLKQFKVQFHLGDKHASVLDRWVSFALDRSAQEIIINLKHADHRVKDLKKYKFPLRILIEHRPVIRKSNSMIPSSSLKRLYLASVCIDSLNSMQADGRDQFDGFSSLTSLTLDSVEISRAQLESMISKCHNIQHLRLMYIDHVEGLEINGAALPALSYLQVKSCYDLISIDIKAASQLVTFEYVGSSFRFNFQDVPQLKSVFMIHKPDHVRDGFCLGLHNLCRNLSRCLTHLENLVVLTTANHFKVVHVPVMLNNLKKLVAVVNASKRSYREWVLYLLWSCRFLEKLDVHFIGSSMGIKRRTTIPERYVHHHLEEVSITGVRGHHDDMAFINRLFYITFPAMKLVTIDPREWVFQGDGQWKVVQPPPQSWTSAKRQWFQDMFFSLIPLNQGCKAVFL